MHDCHGKALKEERERILYFLMISTFHILLLKLFFTMHQNLYKNKALKCLSFFEIVLLFTLTNKNHFEC